MYHAHCKLSWQMYDSRKLAKCHMFRGDISIAATVFACGSCLYCKTSFNGACNMSYINLACDGAIMQVISLSIA